MAQANAEKEAKEKAEAAKAEKEAKERAEKEKAKADAEKPKGKKFVTLFWHEARILTYAGHTYKADDKTGKLMTEGAGGKLYDPTAINRKRGYEGHGSVVRLQPGENVVAEELWEDMQNHETIKQYIDDGKLEEFDPKTAAGKKAPATPGMADDLEAYSYKDAIKLVAETMNVEKLTKWRNNLNPDRDKADQLKDALTTQIAKITASA